MTRTALSIGLFLVLASAATAQTTGPIPTTDGSAGTFDSLSPGNQKIADALFKAQMPAPGTTPLTRDQIAAMKAGQGWGQVFHQLKAQGLVEDTNLGQAISRYNHAGKTSAATIVTTASGRSVVVPTGRARARAAGRASSGEFSRTPTDPGGHGSAHGFAVSHGRGSSHDGGLAAGRDR